MRSDGGSGSGNVGADLGADVQMTCNARADWLAAVTGQLGYAWERALFYVKGGAAWTDEQFAATCNNPGGHLYCANPSGAALNGLTASVNRSGWVLGYGVEFALTRNWSAKAETDYVSFGDTTVSASDGSALNVGMHLWETTVGFNYRFNVGPVAAGY